MFQGCSDSSFGVYLSSWPRVTAFQRPVARKKIHASKSFMIDDILKREEPAKTREQPCQQSKWNISVLHFFFNQQVRKNWRAREHNSFPKLALHWNRRCHKFEIVMRHLSPNSRFAVKVLGFCDFSLGSVSYYRKITIKTQSDWL